MSGLKTIYTCCACGAKNLIPILSLGNIYPSCFVESSNTGVSKAPLDIVLCNANSGGCGLLQLRHTVDRDLLYRKGYWYRSAINETMKSELADIVEKAVQIRDLYTGDIVLDIGCNDGTMLRFYRGKVKRLKLVGFDPAKDLVQYAQVGTTKIFNDYFNTNNFKKEFGNQKVKIITAISMFYDLDDPNEFIKDIVKVLDKDGLFIIQMNYLVSMLERNAFDNIVHEHLEYYSLLALENLLKKYRLEVFDILLNDVNGGSIRAYIRHTECKSLKVFEGAEERLKRVREYEKNIGLNQRKVYDEFGLRINKIKDAINDFIKSETQKNKKVYVYGASTRGNTLLQFFNLNSDLIVAAAERDPRKYGKKTIGTLIPIISEEEARKNNPDYFLVLPWHFLEAFKKRERNYLLKGGKFIVPLPRPRIIAAQGPVQYLV
ncbi:MAG: class I SAM-dependent methyltransferase [Candidatus Nealsonbacteria bacterium]